MPQGPLLQPAPIGKRKTKPKLKDEHKDKAKDIPSPASAITHTALARAFRANNPVKPVTLRPTDYHSGNPTVAENPTQQASELPVLDPYPTRHSGNPFIWTDRFPLSEKTTFLIELFSVNAVTVQKSEKRKRPWADIAKQIAKTAVKTLVDDGGQRFVGMFDEIPFKIRSNEDRILTQLAKPNIRLACACDLYLLQYIHTSHGRFRICNQQIVMRGIEVVNPIPPSNSSLFGPRQVNTKWLRGKIAARVQLLEKYRGRL